MRTLFLLPAFSISLLAACSTLSRSSRVELPSQRTPFYVTVSAPAGWEGPGYGSWSSYDSWSFSRGQDPDASYLAVRFDPVRPGQFQSGAATPEEVVAYFKDTFTNPQAERIATATIDGSPVAVFAIHNVAGEQYATSIRRGDTQISISLDAPDRATLDRHRRTFLAFLNSFRLASTNDA